MSVGPFPAIRAAHEARGGELRDVRKDNAIVGELPTGARAGIGTRLLAGSYYGQTIQIRSALIAASLMAGCPVALVGAAEPQVLKRMGGW